MTRHLTGRIYVHIESTILMSE
uniref:Uncharacterized protein n=1 Tax=Anguilla anguilla TaxID=7936 RepID=A0A0E9SVN4_ANGAN